MKRIAKDVLNTLFSPLGLELVRKGTSAASNYHHSMPDCGQRLAHAKSIGFNPKCVVDAGAYTGGWTEMAAALFPQAEFLVVEPNPHVQKLLSGALEKIQTQTTLIEKALASKPGTMQFNIWGDPLQATSASLQSHVKGGAKTKVDVAVDTLGNLLREQGARADLVKLDLQGAEYRALLGAEQTLKSAEMFVVEFGCLEAYIDRTTPRQLMDIFYDNNFCLYDVVDCHYRPYDGALTGGDFFFVKNDSPLREHKGWD
jgi:FkbM family methyltransferase